MWFWMKFTKFQIKLLGIYEKYPLIANSTAGAVVYFLGEVIVQTKVRYDTALENGKLKRYSIVSPLLHPAVSSVAASPNITATNIVSSVNGSTISFANRIESNTPVGPFGGSFIATSNSNFWISTSAMSSSLNPPSSSSSSSGSTYQEIFNVVYPQLDLVRASYLACLGSLENGAIMYYWYTLLNHFVGESKSTPIVVCKCLLDQLFYATQQDAIFLAVCAYMHSPTLPYVHDELNKNFLTTWIMDCSVWPLVNFAGFAFLPTKLQPTFMSVCQLFWQVYLSSVAAGSEENKPVEIKGEIAKQACVVADKVVSKVADRADEVEKVAAKVAVKVDKLLSYSSEDNGPVDEITQQANIVAERVAVIVKSKVSIGGVDKLASDVASKMEKMLIYSSEETAPIDFQDKIDLRTIAVALSAIKPRSIDLASSSNSSSQSSITSQFSSTMFSSFPQVQSKPPEQKQSQSPTEPLSEEDMSWRKDREAAITNAKVGGSAMLAAALVRRLVFKI